MHLTFYTLTFPEIDIYVAYNSLPLEEFLWEINSGVEYLCAICIHYLLMKFKNFHHLEESSVAEPLSYALFLQFLRDSHIIDRKMSLPIFQCSKGFF